LYASINNGVDDVRERIVGFCEEGSFSEGKLIILDEADRFSVEAQNMLRNVMDRYDSMVRFILTANHISRISPPVAGRCLSLEITNPPIEDFKNRLLYVMDQEGYEVDASLIHEVASKCHPSFRNAINELQKLALGVTDSTASVDEIVSYAVRYLRGDISIQDLRDSIAGSSIADIEGAFVEMFRTIEHHVSPNVVDTAVIELASHMSSLKRGVFPELSFVAALAAIKNS
ncbi:MAG: AAA family ATPase, partial [Gammaproteobacteria bacterium]